MKRFYNLYKSWNLAHYPPDVRNGIEFHKRLCLYKHHNPQSNRVRFIPVEKENVQKLCLLKAIKAPTVFICEDSSATMVYVNSHIKGLVPPCIVISAANKTLIDYLSERFKLLERRHSPDK